MAKYLIKVQGCDGATRVILELTDEEAAVAQRVADEVTRWGAGCRPTMHLRVASDLDIEAIEEDQREWLGDMDDEEGLMSTPDPNVGLERDCSRPSPPLGICIQSLAAGWILPADLCGPCTSRFMAALDAAVPGLRWHENYLKRAGDGDG